MRCKLTVDEMLHDLRSVKMQSKERDQVDRLRRQFQQRGAVAGQGERWLRDACRRYAKQLKELYEARARARRTNALLAMGLSSAEALERVQQRQERVAAAANDLGF